MVPGDVCESAQFRTSQPLSIDDTVGTCSLSKLERSIRPQAYRSSMYRDEYLQDQCHNVCRYLNQHLLLFYFWHNTGAHTVVKRMHFSSLSKELLFLRGVLEHDATVLGPSATGTQRKAGTPREKRTPVLQLTSEYKTSSLDQFFQCEERCDRSEDGFVCRSYTIDYSEKRPLCLLHSDDTIGLGVSSLLAKPNVVYKEQEACLDRTFAIEIRQYLRVRMVIE